MNRMTTFQARGPMSHPRVSACPYAARDEFRRKCAKAPASWVCADLTDDKGETLAIWERVGHEGYGMNTFQARTARPCGEGRVWVKGVVP